MDHLEWDAVAAVASVTGLICAGGFLATAVVGHCRFADDATARFGYGYLGASGFLLGIASGLGLVQVAGPYVGVSRFALIAVIAVNVLLQPLALLFGFTGFRKLTLGLAGAVGVAWKRVPDHEIAKMTVAQRRQLSHFCIVQGLIALPLGMAIAIGCAWPLFQ